MSGNRLFFDTNILVYAHDRADLRKQGIARRLFHAHVSRRELWLSTQVLQEFYVTVSRKIGQITADDAYALTSEPAKLHVATIHARDITDAISLQQNDQLSFWDSLILVTAQKVGAAVLFSEDFMNGRTYGGVRVENPFLAE